MKLRGWLPGLRSWLPSLRSWLHGLAAAVIGGVSTAGSAALVDGRTFNFSHAGLVALGKISATAALIAAFAYLKQSPLPGK